MKEKLETGAMLNPRCQKCRKKDTCNNKTLCAYLIPKEMTDLTLNRNYSSNANISFDVILEPPLVNIEEEIAKQMLSNDRKSFMGGGK